MLNPFKIAARTLWRAPLRNRLVREHAAQRYEPNERVTEYRFVFESLARVSPRTILDVGTGTTALPHLISTCGFVVTAVDNVTDYWAGGVFNRHFRVLSDDITRSALTGSFDVITCISTLEHIKEHDAAVGSMFRLLAPGGHLVLTFPYTEREYSANVYARPDSTYKEKVPYVTQSYSREQLDGWLKSFRGRILVQEYWRWFTGPFWTVGEEVRPAERVGREELHQLTCVLIQKT